MTETDSRTEAAVESAETDDSVAPDDAFAALGNETRLRAIRTVAAAAEPPTFTDLFDASESDTTAGFAYHLRQIVGPYLSKDESTERYTLTSAGRAVARALDAGTFTERVDCEPEAIAGCCPVCDAESLAARVTDNVVGVACTDCSTELLSLPFPPSGIENRETSTVLSAFDDYHRSRIALLADGVCPDCAGPATGVIQFRERADLPGEAARPVLHSSCDSCSFSLDTPVSLAVVDHDAVVGFFRDHDASVRDRPIWNLGPEWTEAVLSEDPPAVAVTVELDGERLRLLVGDGPTVVETERETVTEQPETDAPTATAPTTQDADEDSVPADGSASADDSTAAES